MNKPREFWISIASDSRQVFDEYRNAGCYHVVEVGGVRSYNEMIEQVNHLKLNLKTAEEDVARWKNNYWMEINRYKEEQL